MTIFPCEDEQLDATAVERTAIWDDGDHDIQSFYNILGEFLINRKYLFLPLKYQN